MTIAQTVVSEMIYYRIVPDLLVIVLWRLEFGDFFPSFLAYTMCA